MAFIRRIALLTFIYSTSSPRVTSGFTLSSLSPLSPLASPSFRTSTKATTTTTTLHSTPFEGSLYDDEEANPFFNSLNPLACPPNTKLILGLNKYSHDTTLCAADATTGKVLFALSKERLTRKKHHGGNVATLVETCLDQLELDIDSIQKVVLNNHHHRVLTMEKNVDQLEWETGLGINEGGSDDGGGEGSTHGAGQEQEVVRLLDGVLAACLLQGLSLLPALQPV